ncbi:Gag-Pol polyprotein [Trichinella murrelli]|uniref:Gag-Pol polyprotein n=1 Tax=Trichinella murrelli TaxID=144512 RepID=A0A0V0T5G6_9BILA|nr:Gag-Pol polyprotein [Trichinella murrelli]
MAASTVHRPHAVGATELARLIPVARHCQTSSDPDLRSLWRDGRGVFRVDEDGLLRRRQASSDRADDQLLVPKELRNAVLAAMHNTTFGGHFASRRTLGLPHVCRAKRTDTEIQGAPTDARSILCVPNTGHGLFGPLGRDSYPKFGRFGAPIRLHSDQRRSFESALIREVCKIFDVEKSRSSPYHPHANGLVERTNRTLLNTLAKLCHESKDRSWDQLLPLATVAYNSAVHETTGQSPFCMLFGKQICLSLNATLDVPPGTARNAEDYIVQLRENLQKVHSTAFDRSMRSSSAIRKSPTRKRRRTGSKPTNYKLASRRTASKMSEDRGDAWSFTATGRRHTTPALIKKQPPSEVNTRRIWRSSVPRPLNGVEHGGSGGRPDTSVIFCCTTNVGGLRTDLPRGSGSVTT